MSDRIAKIRNFTRKFGIRGLGVLYRYALAGRVVGRPIQHVALPQVSNSILLRKGTTDRQVFYQVFIQDIYDLPTSQHRSFLEDTYERMILRGETPLIIDCGANVGITSIWLGTRYPKALIYSIEPDSENFEMLQANVKGYSNIVPLHAAIWNRSVPLGLVDTINGAWAYQVAEATEGPIKAVTVQEVMHLAEATQILLIKIDIEGGENALFSDNIDWMSSTTAIAIELHDWLFPGVGSSKTFISALAKYPFEILLRDETLFCVKTPGMAGAKIPCRPGEKSQPLLPISQGR